MKVEVEPGRLGSRVDLVESKKEMAFISGGDNKFRAIPTHTKSKQTPKIAGMKEIKKQQKQERDPEILLLKTGLCHPSEC